MTTLFGSNFNLSSSVAALWRFFMCLSIVYELVLVFMLFQVGPSLKQGHHFQFWIKFPQCGSLFDVSVWQTVDDARQLLTNVDNKLGKPLPEKDYGGNCRIYDPDNLEDPWHNLMVSCSLLKDLQQFYHSSFFINSFSSLSRVWPLTPSFWGFSFTKTEFYFRTKWMALSWSTFLVGGSR